MRGAPLSGLHSFPSHHFLSADTPLRKSAVEKCSVLLCYCGAGLWCAGVGEASDVVGHLKEASARVLAGVDALEACFDAGDADLAHGVEGSGVGVRLGVEVLPVGNLLGNPGPEGMKSEDARTRRGQESVIGNR